jgi:hypothetical protein
LVGHVTDLKIFKTFRRGLEFRVEWARFKKYVRKLFKGEWGSRANLNYVSIGIQPTSVNNIPPLYY